jgi:hypothetical protein
MNFNQLHKKSIALLVVITFIWLLNVTAFPLQAQENPGAVEKTGNPAVMTAKSSILPIVLIVIGVGALAAILFLVILKTSYDITGEWTLNYSWAGSSVSTYPITFTGDKTAGTAHTNLISGTYTVDGSKVTIYLNNGDSKWEFLGEFKSSIRMEGDFKYYINNVLQAQYNGTFFVDKK